MLSRSHGAGQHTAVPLREILPPEYDRGKQQCGSEDCFQGHGYNDEPIASMLDKEGAGKLNGERGSVGSMDRQFGCTCRPSGRGY